METAIKARKRKPIFAVDIAVPRDIEAEVGTLSDVYLYSIDDLDKVVLVGSGDRSERIRTYNFPQGRVTDHRINLTLYKLDEILEGGLDQVPTKFLFLQFFPNQVCQLLLTETG